MMVEIAYFSMPSLRISSSSCVQSAASGPPYLRFCPESVGILDEPVETTTEGVVSIPTLASIPVKQSRYVGMPPEPLVATLVGNETTCWLQSDWENAPKFILGSSAICRHSKFSRTDFGSSSLEGSSAPPNNFIAFLHNLDEFGAYCYKNLHMALNMSKKVNLPN